MESFPPLEYSSFGHLIEEGTDLIEEDLHSTTTTKVSNIMKNSNSSTKRKILLAMKKKYIQKMEAKEKGIVLTILLPLSFY